MSKTRSNRKNEQQARAESLFALLLPHAESTCALALQTAYPAPAPQTYVDPIGYLVDAQHAAFHSKSLFSDGSKVDRVQNALTKWSSAERACALTNARFRHYWKGSTNAFPFAGRHLASVSRRIAEILGPVPSLLSPLIRGRHGPGTTWSLRGDLTCQMDKFAEKCPSVSNPLLEKLCEDLGALSSAYPCYTDAISEAHGTPGFFSSEMFTPVDTARLTTVPKTAIVDRVIEVGPTLNTFFQLGVGGFIRQRLAKKTPLRLDSQADFNRYRVQTDRTCATIDLSSASDHVSYNLVLDLLPPDWVELLDVLRVSRVTTLDDQQVTLQKWSGMGNGYTFELETLIFYAVTECVVESALKAPVQGLVLTFGDDIICPREQALDVIDVLKDLGFITNVQKTFVDGSFRESCGVDVMWTNDGQAVDVRPIYLRADTLLKIEHLYVTANQLYRAHCTLSSCISLGDSDRLIDATELLGRITTARDLVLSWIPVGKLHYGPHYLGDQVIWASDTERDSNWRPRRRKDGLTDTLVWAPNPPRKRLEDYGPATMAATVLQGLLFELDTRTSEVDHYVAYRKEATYSEKRVKIVA